MSILEKQLRDSCEAVGINPDVARLGKELNEIAIEDAIGKMDPDKMIECVRRGVKAYYRKDRATEILARIGGYDET